MNYLLVVPKFVPRGTPYEFYLGLAYISSCLKQKTSNVFCLNLNHSDIPVQQQLSNSIKSHNINVVLTGGMSTNYHFIKDVLDSVKLINPNIITICGGAIVTSNPELAMRNLPIDFGIIGEGELTVPELAHYLDTSMQYPYHDIKGIAFFYNNKLIIAEPRPPITNLDSLPFPDYEGFDYAYFSTLSLPSSAGIFYTVLDEVRPGKIIASRSCPHSCTFCYHPLGKIYRQRSLNNVFEEIDYLVSTYNINLLGLQDELFSFDKQRLYEFASRISPYNLTWGCQLRVSDVDDELLKTLKSSGLYMISYGIESLSPTILKSMKKHTTVPQIENALYLTRKNKIAIQGNILFGDPAETLTTINESFSWWKSHPEYGLNLSMIITLPNSPIYQYALSHNLITDKLQYMKDGLQVLDLTELGTKEFLKLSIRVWSSLSDTSHIKVAKLISSINNTITSVCPECESLSIYKNMHQNTVDKYFLIICRNCHTRLRLETFKCFPESFSYRNYAIYTIFEIARHVLTNSSIVRSLYSKFGNKIVKLLRSSAKLTVK